MGRGMAVVLWVVLGVGFVLWAVGQPVSSHEGAAATLTIEDAEHTTWHTINNQFVRFRDNSYDVQVDFREGVLFQPGLFQHFEDPNDYIDTKMSMAFYNIADPNNPELVLKRSDFDLVGATDPNSVKWVNIYGRPHKMTAADLKYLIPGSKRADECEDLDASVGADKAVYCKQGPCNAGSLKKISKNCIRNTQIHGRLKPFAAVITYWQGLNRYNIRTTAGHDQHNGYAFDFMDSVTVVIHRYSGQPTTLSSINKIRMTSEGAFSHGPHYDPPW